MATYEILSSFPSGNQRKSLAVLRGFAAFRKLVVARQILDDVRDDQQAFEAFLRDVKVAAAFSHPNIADVFDLDAQADQLLLISEFVPGGSLAEILHACRRAKLRLPLELILRVIQHAAVGLHYAHNFVDPSGRAAGIIHRHLDEEALVVSFDGLTKVTDFCVPPAAESQPEADPFRAPEYDWGDSLDGRADVFSLGVVLGRALQEVRQTGGPPVPPALDSVVQRATARTREQRFGSVLEFAKACEAAGGRGWEPAQVAAFMRRLFQDRRARMAELVKLVEVKETTAVMKLSDIFESGGGAGSDAAIAEATQPGLRNPLLPEDDGEDGATSMVLRPPPTVGVAAEPPPQAIARRRPGLRLGRALLKLMVWGGLLGGSFLAGAYVMNPPGAQRLAQTLLRRGAVLAAPASEAELQAASEPAPASVPVSSEDGGATGPEDAGETLAAAPEDAGVLDAGTEEADGGEAKPPAKPKRKRRR